MQFITFIGFTLIVAVVAYLKTRNTNEGSSDGYFLGGRSLTAGVIAGSLLLTNLSTEQIVGLNGSAYQSGLSVMVWETLAAIAMVVTAMFLLPRYLKGGLTTVPGFLSKRFDVTTKTLTSVLFLTGYVVVLLPVILYSGSLAISDMFDVPELLGVSRIQSIWICVWGIGIVGSIYAVFGGLKAVAVSDTINAIGLLIGGILIPIFGLMFIGDEGNILDGLSKLTSAYPEKFNSIGGANDPVPFYTIFTGMMLVQLFYWGTNQQIIQRALGAKNLKEGQKGLLLASFIKILGPIIVVLPGLIAYYIFQGNLESADSAYPMLVKKVLPNAWIGFFAAVLFGAILSSFNSVLNSSVTLFGIDIYKQHLNKDADEKTVVKYGKTFGVILAIASMFIAPLIANAKSLFDYLQEINGIYSIPILTIIVVGYLTKRVPASAAKIGLISGSLFYIISQFGLKPHFEDKTINSEKIQVIAIAEDISFEAKSLKDNKLFEKLNKSIFNLKNTLDIDADLVNDVSENLSNIRSYAFEEDKVADYNTFFNLSDKFNNRIKSLKTEAYPHFLDIMAILFLLNVAIMLIIGKISPRMEDYVQKYTEQVDITPWRYVKQAGLTICIIVIAVYIYFA